MARIVSRFVFDDRRKHEKIILKHLLYIFVLLLLNLGLGRVGFRRSWLVLLIELAVFLFIDVLRVEIDSMWRFRRGVTPERRIAFVQDLGESFERHVWAVTVDYGHLCNFLRLFKRATVYIFDCLGHFFLFRQSIRGDGAEVTSVRGGSLLHVRSYLLLQRLQSFVHVVDGILL